MDPRLRGDDKMSEEDDKISEEDDLPLRDQAAAANAAFSVALGRITASTFAISGL